MRAPSTQYILADNGFKTWWKKQHPRLSWEMQVSMGRRDWLADYEDYLIFQGISPPWLTETPRPSPTYTDAQMEEYIAYIAFLKTEAGKDFPHPKDIDDYFANKDKWAGQYPPVEPTPEEPTPEEPTPEEPEYTTDQKREYQRYWNYADAYGEPGDWYPLNMGDYFKNRSVAQEQLNEWLAAEQTRQSQTAAAEAQQAEYELWQLSPEEAARRREESYAATQYARQEAYGETPRYPETFYGWLSEQGDMSKYLRNYIENKYPSLREQYEATLPRLTGYPTREQARTEAAKRESGWQAWLATQMPEVESQFWRQTPYERGERPGTFAPATRTVLL